MAQLVKHLTLDLVSGHDLIVHETEPQVRLCTDCVEPAWDALSVPLPHSLFFFSLSLKINIKKKKKKKSKNYT